MLQEQKTIAKADNNVTFYQNQFDDKIADNRAQTLIEEKDG